MKRCLLLPLLCCSLSTALVGGPESSPTNDVPTVLLVVGAPGEDQYTGEFTAWTALWNKAATQASANLVIIGLDPPHSTNDLDLLRQTLASEPLKSPGDLWIVLIGHGTFDGREARFNLRGPDFSASDLAGWLKPFSRPLAVINCASASAPFIPALSAPNRVIVTATRSGHEQNYARFGRYFARSIADPEADLDKDGQTSLLEAFLAASHQVAEFYTVENRLATEHPLLDDNGDGLGTPGGDWFRGIHAVKKAAEGASLDGRRAHQFHLVRSALEQKLPSNVRAQRDKLELAISGLRDHKKEMDEDTYYRQLEELLIDLARIYDPGP